MWNPNNTDINNVCNKTMKYLIEFKRFKKMNLLMQTFEAKQMCSF